MFVATDNSRKRPRRRSSSDILTTDDGGIDENNDDNAKKKNADVVTKPVVCLTGFTPEEKEHYHTLIEDLGGRYTQDLNSTRNTHLVAKVAQGAKYEAACKLRNSRSNKTGFCVVGASWLEDCHEQQAWIHPPRLHHCKVSGAAGDDDKKSAKSTGAATAKSKSLCSVAEPSLHERLKGLLATNKPDTDRSPCSSSSSRLFEDCQFLLIGFDEKDEERNALSTLLGRGLGTIYWELNDSITHVIIQDGCDDSLREVTERIVVQHPNAPFFVSPWWVLASWKHEALQDPLDFAPKYRLTPPEPMSKKQKATHSSTAASTFTTRPQITNLFRGCIFAFLRVSPPPGTVDYETNKLESLIASQSGQLLSTQLLDALKVDLSRNTNNNVMAVNGDQSTAAAKKKKCYVICWGGDNMLSSSETVAGTTAATTYYESLMTMHPLLAQVKRNSDLADIVEVTPIWLKTCCTEQRIVSPKRLPILFQPTAWAIHSLASPVHVEQQEKSLVVKKEKKLADDKDNSSKCRQLRISVSGFSGSRRTAMIHLIQVMGAQYDDSMRTSTTHLICAKASSGLKYKKAVEWKLHVVSLDWLYHVAQYGYHGKQQQQQQQQSGDNDVRKVTGAGCEDRFSLTAPTNTGQES